MTIRPSGRGPGRPNRRPAPVRPRPDAGEPIRLSAPRDTGIVLGQARSSIPRPGRGPASRRDDWVLPLIGVVVLALGAGLVSYWGTIKPPPPPQPKAAEVPAPLALTAPKVSAGASPCFATYGNLRVHLPVPAESVTTVAFHQATFNHAVPMVSLVPDMSLGNAKTAAAELRAVASGAATSAPTAAALNATAAAVSAPQDVWRGSVIRLYRSGRSGRPETAVDVGAPPGTAVLAPVDGTVVLVRPYRLYNKYDDYEVHISPSAQADVDAIVIHITDVCVQPGQRVEGGVTRIASVRRLSDRTDLQLADYTADGGDHAHFQINRLPQPGMLWISTPGGLKVVPFQLPATGGSTGATAAPPAGQG